MSEMPPDLPRAKRVAPPVVTVRPADVQPEPDDEPTGPPKVLFWFRLMCVLTALAAFVLMCLLGADIIQDGWEAMHPPWLVGIVVAFVAYSLPLWWRRPRRWHWVYGVAVMLPHLVPPITNPLVVALVVFWCRKPVTRYFRHPPVSYAPTPVDPPAPTDPPTVLFALRWMCLIGCGVCLLGIPLSAVLHAADPDAGWGVMGWLGGFAMAFVLFAVPLFARIPRPWVWWYGLGLLVLCSLSLYFTVLAVPILVFWLMKGPRRWFARNVLVNPGSHAGGEARAEAPPA